MNTIFVIVINAILIAAMFMFTCVRLPQVSTCPRSSDVTAATWTRSPSPTDRCLSTLSESRKGTLSYFTQHSYLLVCIPVWTTLESQLCVGWIQVCLLCQLVVLLKMEQLNAVSRADKRSRWHWKTRKRQKTESRLDSPVRLQTDVLAGRRCVGVDPSETSHPFCLRLCQSWGRHANHVGGEAAEGNAHSAEPDRRSAGFWSEPQPDFDQYYPLTWNPFYWIAF